MLANLTYRKAYRNRITRTRSLREAWAVCQRAEVVAEAVLSWSDTVARSHAGEGCFNSCPPTGWVFSRGSQNVCNDYPRPLKRRTVPRPTRVATH